MKQRLVSVLIVSYNAEKYIEKTLRSCLAQTYSNFEILILDNASSDRTLEIIRNLNDSRIVLFEGQENIGSYAGLNFLLDKANGEYIAIQDHDDIWLPEKLTKQIEFLENNKNRSTCGTRTYYFYENRKILILDEKNEELSFVDHTSLVFRNTGYRYDTSHLLADEYFEKVVLNGNKEKIHCLKEALAIHRIRGDRNNLSRNRFAFSRKNITEYFFINGFSPSTFIGLAGIFVAKHFPAPLEWFIIDKIIKRGSEKIKLETFQEKYPGLL